jgi:hypothetical protein
MLEGAAKSHGDASVRCIGEVSGNIMSGNKFGKFGEKVYDGTGSWRCPDLTDLTDLSEGLRSVATYYEAKNNKENLLKAKRKEDAFKRMSDNCNGKYKVLDEGAKAEGGIVTSGVLVPTEFWYISYECLD